MYSAMLMIAQNQQQLLGPRRQQQRQLYRLLFHLYPVQLETMVCLLESLHLELIDEFSDFYLGRPGEQGDRGDRGEPVNSLNF